MFETRTIKTLIIALALLTSACSDDASQNDDTDAAIAADAGADTTTTADAGEDVDTEPVNVTVEGAVHKGPYLLGSSVTLARLDSNWATTGEVFSSQTKNDLGQFDLRLTVPSQGIYGELEGEGFYYNEISGEVSAAQLTLRGYAKITQAGTQNVFLNLVTHLSNRRVLYLLLNPSSIDTATYDSGDVFVDAIAQAEDELVDALDIGPSNFELSKDGSKVNVLQGSNADNAYMLALSAVFVKTAELRETASIDSALQELLNTVANDLQSDGQLDQATVDSLQEAEASIDGDMVMQKFRQRLDDLGQQSLEVPNIHLALDSNNDGRSNADDGFLCGDGVPHPDNVCFGMPAVVAVNSTPLGDRDDSLFVLADFDGDGSKDMLLPFDDQSSFSIHKRTGPTTFDREASGVDIVHQGVKYWAHHWAAGDLHGDNTAGADLVFAQYETCDDAVTCLNGAGSKLVVLEFDPSDTIDGFKDPQVIGDEGSFRPTKIRLADLDANGHLDIVALRSGLVEQQSTAGDCALSVQQVDGEDVYSNKQPDSVGVFLADDNGAYPSTPSQTFVVTEDGSLATGSSPAGFVRDIEVGDLDGDGAGELVLSVAPSCGVGTDQQKSLVRIHEFNAGAFEDGTDIERPAQNVQDVALLNIDGNARLDVAFTEQPLAGGRRDLCYAVYFNHGGTAQALIERPANDTCRPDIGSSMWLSVPAADFDADGTDDILMGVVPEGESHDLMQPSIYYGGASLDPTTASVPYQRLSVAPPMTWEQINKQGWTGIELLLLLSSSIPEIVDDFDGDGLVDILFRDDGNPPFMFVQNP